MFNLHHKFPLSFLSIQHSGRQSNQPEPATSGKKMESSGDHDQLHIFFFPFMAHGHTIPCVDMAKLFAARGHRATIVTTPLNRPPIAKSIQSSQSKGLRIDVRTVRFSAVEAGLPEGHENADAVTSGENAGEMLVKFFSAVSLLQEPFEELLLECRPDCVVADMFFPWATDSCSEFGIPRLVFHGTSSFSLCAGESIRLYSPHKKVSSDSEQFVLPNFPGEIKLTRNELPDFMKQDENPDSFMFRLLKASKESEVKSFGVVVNSFYELEPAYADHYRNVLGRRAWYIGPVSLSGRLDSIDENGFLKWLDSKEPNSVVYVCFGSMVSFNSAQLKEIAKGLEASGQDFIWVIRRKDQSEEWLPEGFEERVGGRGLIIRGWAPQVSILDHEAVGGFVTHCGWNSTLEGITAGKPMLTWPLFAEQFYNEKLVTQVLRTGVSVGATKWARLEGEHVASDAVENGVRRVMAGEEADEMRERAKRLGEKAHIAVEEGGSSFHDFHVLIQDLVLARPRS